MSQNTLKITSSSNQIVLHWKKLMDNARYRNEKRKILVEGKNLLIDLLPILPPNRLILTETMAPSFAHASCPIVLITDTIAQKISSVKTPEGVFAEYDIPEEKLPPSIQKGLVLDSVQDPGNIGTLIRTAFGLDLDAIFFIGNSCDPFNPKAVRAAKGTQFLIPLIHTTIEKLPQKIPLLVADLHGTPLPQFSCPSSWLLLLGNESHGPKLPKNHPSIPIRIPMNPKLNSFNVAQAGAILMYSLKNFSCILTV